jgi:hypothetical protein
MALESEGSGRLTRRPPGVLLHTAANEDAQPVADHGGEEQNRHAPAKLTHVEVEYGESELTVSVVNDIGEAPAATLSGGYGMPGMRERMAEAGGTLSAGRAGDQWRVEARVSA